MSGPTPFRRAALAVLLPVLALAGIARADIGPDVRMSLVPASSDLPTAGQPFAFQLQVTSATATIPLAAIAWWVNGAMTAAATLLVSALWHLAAWRLTLRRLHDLIALTTGDSTKATP